MLHVPAGPVRRLDLAILTASAVLCVFLAVATDREYRATFGTQEASRGDATRLPRWVKERRHDAVRLVHGGAAVLSGLGIGLAVVTLRPRAGTARRGAFGPGETAAILTAGFALVLALCWAVEGAIDPRLAPGAPLAAPVSYPLGIYVGFYAFWGQFRPQVTWMVLGAWSTLLATGRWRRPVAVTDRLGVGLGIGWLVLMAGQAAVFVIAWY